MFPKVIASLVVLVDGQGQLRRRHTPSPSPRPTPWGPTPAPPAPPTPPAPPANSTNVWPQDRCQGAVESVEWPTFNTMADLQADGKWADYFTAVYGGVPDTGYPICTSSLTWIATKAMANSVGHTASQCDGEVGEDFAHVTSMSGCCDPGTSVATYLWNVNNVGWAIPDNMWVEVMHIYFTMDKGVPWYYIAQGSAVWLYTGKTKVYEDHPDGVRDLLNTECHDQGHTSQPPTECEGDFTKLASAGIAAGYQSIQFTKHYDCACGTQGVGSWDRHTSICQTEIIDLTGDTGARRSGCANSGLGFRAGWAAQEQCECDTKNNYINCEGYGLSAIEVL